MRSTASLVKIVCKCRLTSISSESVVTRVNEFPMTGEGKESREKRENSPNKYRVHASFRGKEKKKMQIFVFSTDLWNFSRLYVEIFCKSNDKFRE